MTRRRLIWVAVAVAILLPLVLIFDTAPKVAVAGAPAAEQVRAGRAAFKRLREAMAGPPPATRAEFSATDLTDIAAMVSNVARVDRIAAGIRGGAVRAAASIEMPLGLWINVTAKAPPTTTAGFPAISMRVGDLPLPSPVVRAGAEAFAALLRLRGARLPPLDELVQALSVTETGMAVLVKSPVIDTGLVKDMLAVAASPADRQRTAEIYCRLAALQAESPSNDLAVQLARAMGPADPAGGAATVAENRAALVAVAMLAVGPSAGQLASNPDIAAPACQAETGRIELAGRRDLAKHWSLSAALGATFGGDIGQAMGNWKELSDSLAGGSGFSFVDLAADRAGLQVGRIAVDTGTAPAIRRELRTANNQDLLPLDAKALAEGMSNEEFVARYGSIDSANYAAKLARIDALLEKRATLGFR